MIHIVLILSIVENMQAIMSGRKRPRFAGSSAELVDVLENLVALKGKSFCRYSEKDYDLRGEADQEKMKKFGEGFRFFGGETCTEPVFQGDPSPGGAGGSFGKSTKKEWKMSDSFATDWHITMTKRLRNMLGDGAACIRKKTKWFYDLLHARDTGPASWSSSVTTLGTDTTYGWHAELDLGWRQRGENTGPELSLPISIGDEVPDSQGVVAEWRDGDMHLFFDVTGGALRENSDNNDDNANRGFRSLAKCHLNTRCK